MIKGSKIMPVVVVPVHRPEPTAMETVSLRQLGKVLGHGDIWMLAPEGLDLGRYRELMPISGEVRVAGHWMESLAAYNRLMISPVVYDALGSYSHMLLHEPDAIVIRDELEDWCVKPYDYVGAVWFKGFGRANADSPVLGVGNSGFSLLRLESFRQVTRSHKRWYPYRQVIKDLLRGCYDQPGRLKTGFRALGASGELRCAYKLYQGQCDGFWSFLVPEIEQWFSVAPPDQAIRFSWEVLPERCMGLCNGMMPFGIHAWAKYEYSFLAQYLAQADIDLEGFDPTSSAISKTT